MLLETLVYTSKRISALMHISKPQFRRPRVRASLFERECKQTTRAFFSQAVATFTTTTTTTTQQKRLGSSSNYAATLTKLASKQEPA